MPRANTKKFLQWISASRRRKLPILPLLYSQAVHKLSPHLIADSTAPRAFIWHTFQDRGVPAVNSLLYAKRLIENGVNTELHIYPQGPHGKGLAQDLPHTQNWTRELLEWLYLDDI